MPVVERQLSFAHGEASPARQVRYQQVVTPICWRRSAPQLYAALTTLDGRESCGARKVQEAYWLWTKGLTGQQLVHYP
jgi:hypothetical protein